MAATQSASRHTNPAIQSHSDATQTLERARRLRYTDAKAAIADSEAVTKWARANRAIDLQAHATVTRGAALLWSDGSAAAIDAGRQALVLYESIGDESGAVETTCLLVAALNNSQAYATCNALIDHTLGQRRCSPVERAHLLRCRATALAHLGELDKARILINEQVLPTVVQCGTNAQRSMAYTTAAFIELQFEYHASDIQSQALLQRRPQSVGRPKSHVKAALQLLLQAETLSDDVLTRVLARGLKCYCVSAIEGPAAAAAAFAAVNRDALVDAPAMYGTSLVNYAESLRIAGDDAGAIEQLNLYSQHCNATGSQASADALFEQAVIAERGGRQAEAAQCWQQFARARMAWSAGTVEWFEVFSPSPGFKHDSPSAPTALVPRKHFASSNEPPLVQAFHAMVTTQGANRRTVLWYCKQLGTSRRVLEDAVSTHRNTTPLSVIKQHRLQLAVRMIETTGAQMADISELLGYSTPSAFNADFKARFGVTPSQWRRRSAAA